MSTAKTSSFYHLLRFLKISMILTALFFYPLKASAVSVEALKISYIYNMMSFMTWPPESFKTEASNIQLCIFGENFFEKARDLLDSRKTKKRDIALKNVHTSTELNNCHILYIDGKETENIDDFLKSIKKQPIFTMSDSHKFAAKGGMVGFVVVDNNLKFEVNLNSIKAAHLDLSSRMLALSFKVIK